MVEHSYRFTPRKHTDKTVFLWYLLRYRLSLSLPTVFASGGTYYFFHETGVYVASTTAPGYFLSEDVNTASGSKLVWALIDRMNKSTEPPAWLVLGYRIPKCVAVQVLDEGLTLSC